VVFLLLGYFVVTATFSPDEGVLTARLPVDCGGLPRRPLQEPQVPLRINIASAGVADYYLSIEVLPDSPRDVAGLTRLMRDYAAAGTFDRQTKPIVIRPDGHVRWQHVTNVFNAMIAAEFRHVSFSA